MKKVLKIPLRRIQRRPPPAESLRAKAAAAEAEAYDEEEYESEEPNMKFSHALIVVLALHVIAVGGVFAFNSIKASHASPSKAQSREETASPPTQATAEPRPPARQASEARPGKTYTVQAGDTLSRIASLYKVEVEAIEKENGITSYSMIRVGQILKIPAATTQKEEPAKPSTNPTTTAAKQAFLSARSDLANPLAPAAARAETATPASHSVARTNPAKPPAPAAQTEAAKPHPQVAKPLPAVAATPKPATTQTSPKKAEEAPAPAPESPDTYVVAKGDNPYSIAKKLHVSYNELITINDIKDPTRVQIGQKLKIPAKKN